jgi:hypothetical protein
MNTTFKANSALFAAMRQDLRRPHAFAHERIGFLSAGIAATDEGLLLLARSYRPIADEDYLPDPSVGAMMNAVAIRKALQWAMSERVAIFNVHSHGGRGVPGFSTVDLRESAKYVPDFFKLAASRPHGAIVLSNDAAYGKIWFNKGETAIISKFVEVGAPLRKWMAA